MQIFLSKPQFKLRVLEYLHKVEKEKQCLIITSAGKPIVKIIPYLEKDVLKSLHSTLIKYENPNEPVGLEDWEALK